MSKVMKFTIIQVMTWFIVGVFMLSIMSNDGVIENWGDSRLKTLLVALLFLFGFTTDFIIRIIEKTKRWGFIRDERDQAIQLKAMSSGFVIVLLYIFLITISLYTKFELQGLMPVGYVWFIAYSMIVVANLAVGIPSIILYWKQGY